MTPRIDQHVALVLLTLNTLLPSARGETAAPAAPVPQVDLERLKRPDAARPPSDLFRARSWEPPRAPQRKAPEPPPAPVAPPLPFTYVGKWLERGETIVVLARDRQHYIVHAGENLDGTYVLESIDNDRLVIRYLPLNVAQVLSFSSGAPAGAPRTPQLGNPGNTRPNQKPTTRDADDEDD